MHITAPPFPSFVSVLGHFVHLRGIFKYSRLDMASPQLPAGSLGISCWTLCGLGGWNFFLFFKTYLF